MTQGFFSIQQTCPTCRGNGKVIADPCAALIWGDEPAARAAQMRPLTDSMRRLPELVNALL